MTLLCYFSKQKDIKTSKYSLFVKWKLTYDLSSLKIQQRFRISFVDFTARNHELYQIIKKRISFQKLSPQKNKSNAHNVGGSGLSGAVKIEADIT